MVMFFSGFALSSAATLLLYHSEPVLDCRLRAETKAGIGLGVGVLCGLVAMLVSSIGLLVSGLQLGSLISLAILVLIGQFHSLTPAWASLGTILALSIVTAVFTLLWQKLFAVVYTSVFGAAVMMLCVDYLLGTFVPHQVHDILSEAVPRPFCWFNWVIAGLWPVMSFIGLTVQWRVTARGVSHTGEFPLHCLKKMKFGCINTSVNLIRILFSSKSQTEEILQETERVKKKTDSSSATASTTAALRRRCARPGWSLRQTWYLPGDFPVIVNVSSGLPFRVISGGSRSTRWEQAPPRAASAPSHTLWLTLTLRPAPWCPWLEPHPSSQSEALLTFSHHVRTGGVHLYPKDVSPLIRKASAALAPDGESKSAWTLAARISFACVFIWHGRSLHLIKHINSYTVNIKYQHQHLNKSLSIQTVHGNNQI